MSTNSHTLHLTSSDLHGITGCEKRRSRGYFYYRWQLLFVMIRHSKTQRKAQQTNDIYTPVTTSSLHQSHLRNTFVRRIKCALQPKKKTPHHVIPLPIRRPHPRHHTPNVSFFLPPLTRNLVAPSVFGHAHIKTLSKDLFHSPPAEQIYARVPANRRNFAPHYSCLPPIH